MVCYEQVDEGADNGDEDKGDDAGYDVRFIAGSEFALPVHG